MATKLGIIARAASRTGNGVVTSLDDGSDIARLTDEHYEAIVEEYLTQHGWKFARWVEGMQLTEQTPEKPWAQLWRKPAEILSLQYVVDANAQRVDQEERDTDQGSCCAVMCEHDELYAVGTHRADESRWPGDFAMGIEHRMRGVFYGGIAEQHDLAEQQDRKAELIIQRARVRDQRASTAPDAGEWDLAAARNRRGAWDNRAYR